MRHRSLAGIIIALSSIIGCTSTTQVAALKCENRINPLGIDETRPRLTWILKSSERYVAQSAYQIIVATDPQNLNEGTADLWNTGKVASGDSHAFYAGPSLRSGDRGYW